MKKKMNFGKEVKVIDIKTNEYHTYRLPAAKDFYENYEKTYGTQYDDIEKDDVKGGVPLLWERVG